MPETQVIDEVVNERPVGRTASAVQPRPVENESVSNGGATKTTRAGIEEETISEGARKGRVLKESTQKLLQSFEEGDADEDEPQDDADGAGDADEGDPDESGENAGDADAGDQPGDAAAAAAEAAGKSPDEVEQIREQAARLEARNRELLTEVEAARKTPKAQRTERETALLAAESSYIEEGSIPALRKFLSVIVGAAPDSKEVDAELAGLYTDLSARELGVALDQNQQALRDNARTRLLLARDKREKAEGNKKAEVDNGADEAAQVANAAKYVDNLLTTKGTSGTSIADEFPMLMDLAEDFDGYKPGEVIARAVRQEYMTGTLDPRISETEAIRTVAQKIEKHYDAVAKKIEAIRAKQKKPDTTTPSDKTPKVADEASKAAAKSTGARTITNATASRAPAKLPKTTKQKDTTSAGKKTRKDFPTESAWKDYLLDYHSKS